MTIRSRWGLHGEYRSPKSFVPSAWAVRARCVILRPMPLTVPDSTLAPDALRLVIGGLGSLSLLFGARLYKPALFGSAFAVGVVGVFAAASSLSVGAIGALPLLITALIAGAAVAIVAGIAHRVALIAIGAIAGAVAGLGIASVLVLPFWVPLLGALIGALALPWGLHSVLKVVTPVVGATLIGWAAGWLDRPLWLAGLVAVGLVVQLSTGGKGKSRKKKKRKEDA